MAVLRVTSVLQVTAAPGSLAFEDTNFPDRAGWKEIVISAGKRRGNRPGFPLGRRSQPRAHGLSAGPSDGPAPGLARRSYLALESPGSRVYRTARLPASREPIGRTARGTGARSARNGSTGRFSVAAVAPG
jgi:hypothetical protein